MGVTFQIPSKPEIFVLCPPLLHPVLDVTSDSICVCGIHTSNFFFFIQRIVINKQKRQRRMFIQPSYKGNDVRTLAQTGLKTPSSGKSGSTEPLPEMINPSLGKEIGPHLPPLPYYTPVSELLKRLCTRSLSV